MAKMLSMRRTLMQIADFVISSIEGYGIKVSPSSRLQIMRKIFLTNDGAPKMLEPSDSNFQIGLEASRDFQQLQFIIARLTPLALGNEFKSRLRKIVGDNPLPQDHVERTTGRDAQCECYVAAICAKALLQPSFAEPDIICTANDSHWGIAVKRIKRYARFEERVKDAIDQVQRQRMPGILFCDVSVMLNRDNQRITASIDDKQFYYLANLAFKNFVHDHYDKLMEWRRGTEVRGIIFADHHIRQHPDYGCQLESFTMNCNLSDNNQRRNKEFLQFCELFRKGYATPPVP
jgi:hypothetical protein